MNIDTKLPAFKSFIAENRLNNGGVKTTIDQSAVAANHNDGVDLNLQNDESGSGYERSKKKKKEKSKSHSDKKNNSTLTKKTDAEVKEHNMKLLNLL